MSGESVLLHGSHWYFDGTPRCPECISDRVQTVKELQDKDTAAMRCSACGCKWTQTREECAE